MFGSEEFQRSVWIRGDHPAEYVQDYAEAVEVLRDFVGWLLEDDEYRNVPFTDRQAERLRGFVAHVEEFDDQVPVRDAVHMLADRRWPGVVAEASRTLQVLLEGEHGLRPQIVDP